MLLADGALTDTRVTNEADTLAARGHDVTIVMLGAVAGEERREGYAVRTIPALRLSIARRLLLAVISPWRWRLALAERLYARQRREAASGEGGSVAARAIPGRIDRWRFPIRLLFVRLHGILADAAFSYEAKRLRPDVVHAHDLITLRIANEIARQVGARVVYDAHELFPERGGIVDAERRFWRDQEAEEIRACDVVLTVNPLIADELKRRYAVRDVTVVHNAAPFADETAERAKSRMEIQQRLAAHVDCLLLYLGGLTPERGIEELITALSLLPPTFGLLMMGDGSSRPALEEHARGLGVHGRIAWLGMVPRADVPRIAAAADVGLVTQKSTGLNEHLCSPNRLSDYLNAGVALGVSDLPFLREFVARYGCGVTFAIEPAAIAAALEGLGGNRTRLEECRARSRAAAKEFNWENESLQLLAAYESLRKAS